MPTAIRNAIPLVTAVPTVLWIVKWSARTIIEEELVDEDFFGTVLVRVRAEGLDGAAEAEDMVVDWLMKEYGWDDSTEVDIDDCMPVDDTELPGVIWASEAGLPWEGP